MKKQVIIESLEIVRFKGLTNVSIDFRKETNIYGANGSGKTTIFDAFTWLLFGKDSSEKKDFSVKTKDLNGEYIPKQEVEVNAVISVNGEKNEIKRVLREKWVRKHGTEDTVFEGNDTVYFWNDVPVKLGEYNQRISAILEESIFKLITNPLAFNSAHWKDRRKTLFEIVGEETDKEFARGKEGFERLIIKIGENKTIQEYETQIKASTKKAKDELKLIPSRIDEVERSKPEKEDFAQIEIAIKDKQTELEGIENQINDTNKAFDDKLQEQRSHKIKVANIQSELEAIELRVRNEIKSESQPNKDKESYLLNLLEKEKFDYDHAQAEYTDIQKQLNEINATVSDLEQRAATLRDDWAKENLRTIDFKEGDFSCPTCKRSHDGGDLEKIKSEMIEAFNKDKQLRIDTIISNGKRTKDEIERLKEKAVNLSNQKEKTLNFIQESKEKIEVVKADIEALKKIDSEPIDIVSETEKRLSANKDYQVKIKELKEVEKMIVDIPSVDVGELVTKKKELADEISGLKSRLFNKALIEKAEERKQELLGQEKKLSKQITEYEQDLFLIEQFTQAKINHLESKINDRFKMVRFKMFDKQINGGLNEVCEATVNGVPYSDVNNASKINAGIDIINTLCDYYEINAPIFIDNRESVTELIETESQIVNLFVSAEDASLRVD